MATILRWFLDLSYFEDFILFYENFDTTWISKFMVIITDILISKWIYILLAGLIYYYVFLPINWVKDLTDLSYDIFEKEQKRYGKKKNKHDLVNDIRRKRVVGDVPPVFPNGWFMVCESKDVARGQVKYVAALGENFAVFRNKENDDVYIVDAYCPHLGANLAVGGTVQGDCLECPFHGWRFSGKTGACSSIPYTEKVPETARVKKWQSCEINGFIFVWYHAEDVEPEWSLVESARYNTEGWIYRGRNDYLINVHIQEIPENGCDIAHFESVHGEPMILGGGSVDLSDSLLRRIYNLIFRHAWSATWTRCEEPNRSHVADITLTHHIRVFKNMTALSVEANVYQIGPGYVEFLLQTSYGPMIFIQTVTPVEPLVQRVIHRFYCVPSSFLFATVTIIGESIMFQRDVAIWNHLKYEAKPFLVKGDGKIAAFRRWYSQFYSENSPTLASIQQKVRDCSLDW